MVIPDVSIKSSTTTTTDPEEEKMKKTDATSSDNRYRGAVVLTEGALLVYNSQENKMTSIFPLREVELVRLLEDDDNEDDDCPLSIFKLQVGSVYLLDPPTFGRLVL